MVAVSAALMGTLGVTSTRALGLDLIPKRDKGGSGGGPACYLAGSRILTPDGERNVEDLAIGDLVVTFSGAAKPIKWIGQKRTVRGEAASFPADVTPIRIARFALDESTPSRDLLISPLHALYIDGVLVEAGSLVNGETITRCDGAQFDAIEYFHIELSEPDVIFAEGVATESFVPSVGRQMFDNWAEYSALYGDDQAAEPVERVVELRGRRRQLNSRLRSAISPWIDVRRPVDIVRDRIDHRAENMKVAA